MGRVKAMMMENDERELERLQGLWNTDSITEASLLDAISKVCNDDEADDVFWQMEIEKTQYEADNSQFGAGA